MAGAGDVRALIADAAKFDYASLGPIAFCLLDVDLYIPTREALPKIYKQLSPGGVMIIDDCKPGGDWDGALQAYQEYCADRRSLSIFIATSWRPPKTQLTAIRRIGALPNRRRAGTGDDVNVAALCGSISFWAFTKPPLKDDRS